MNSTHISPETQLDRFRAAVDALGGIRPTARYLGVSERSVSRLYSGKQKLHDGWLRDTAAALIDHASTCRTLERAITPSFSENLTADQANRLGEPDGRRIDG